MLFGALQVGNSAAEDEWMCVNKVEKNIKNTLQEVLIQETLTICNNMAPITTQFLTLTLQSVVKPASNDWTHS